jgi:hypothetical protein
MCREDEQLPRNQAVMKNTEWNVQLKNNKISTVNFDHVAII